MSTHLDLQPEGMASSPPIGTSHTEYVKMLEEERIGLKYYRGKIDQYMESASSQVLL